MEIQLHSATDAFENSWIKLISFLSYWHKIQVTTKNFAIGTTYNLRDTIPIPL